MTHCRLRSGGLIETYLSLKKADIGSRRESNHWPEGCSCKHFHMFWWIADAWSSRFHDYPLLSESKLCVTSWGRINTPEDRLKKKWRQFKEGRAVKRACFHSARMRQDMHADTHAGVHVSPACAWGRLRFYTRILPECDMWHQPGL